MNAKTEAAIRIHGGRLLDIFPGALERDPVKLCKRLRRYEREGAAIALRLCNGPEYAEGEAERKASDLLAKVNAYLGNEGGAVDVFINLDPRGYALKIDDAWMREAEMVLKDGLVLYVGTKAVDYMHRLPYSIHHATKYEGYTVGRVNLQGDLGGYGLLAPDLTMEE